VRFSRLTPFAFCLALLAGCDRGDERVELRFWGLGREGEVVAELAREFERANPGVVIRVQQIPWTAAHEKLLTAYVGEATPDLAQLGNTWVPEFTAVDALERLDSWIAASQTVTQAGYFDGIWQTNVIDGGVYGLPWYVDTRVLFYRTDILKEAGYDSIPGSWPEWREAMHRVDGRGTERYAIFLPTNEWAQPVMFGLQAGSPLLAENGRRGAFSEPAFRDAFTFYIELYRSGLAPVMGNNDMANVYQEFARGFFSMYITGPWNIGEFQRRLPADMEGKWATATMPGPDGAESGVSLAGGSSLVLFRASEHKEEAWRFMEYLARPDVQFRFFQLTGDLPARIEAWQDSALIGNAYARAFYNQLQRVVPTPKVPEWEQIATKIYEAAESVIRGSVSIDAALEALDRDVDELLAKRRQLLDEANTGS
jgi:multiple sugar transport system substrate-binding protein